MSLFCKSIVCLLISSIFWAAPMQSKGQETRGTESIAIEYFNAKKYDQALPLFTELINKSPDNAMYNYYYGVTLLKNNHFETAAKEALLNAVVDNTPSNSNFYLGNYFHALENWSEAMDFYRRYKGSKQEARALEYDKYVDLCNKHINPFKVDKGDDKAIFVDTAKAPPPPHDEKIFPIPDSLKTEWFNFQINSQLTYHGIDDFRSEAAKILFAKAWIATTKNDSIVQNTDMLRKAHEETNNVQTRLALVQRIVEAEQQSYEFLREREKYFEQARVKESAYWEKTKSELMSDFIDVIAKREKERAERIMNEKRQKEIIPVEIPPTPPAVEVAATNVADSLKQASLPVIQPAPKDNVVFKVQIGSFKNGKLTADFKAKYAKISKFRKIDKYTDEKKYEIYTVGNFTVYNDATLLKNQLIMEGMKGAFLAAFNNGVRVPVASVVKDIPSK